MSDTVESGLGHLFCTWVGEVGEPFLECAVRGHNQAFLLVAVVGYEVEKQFDGVVFARRVAKFIQNDEIGFGQAFVEARVVGRFGFAQLSNERGQSVECDLVEVPAGLDAEGDGKVSLAGAWAAIHEDAVFALDKHGIGVEWPCDAGRHFHVSEVEISQCFEFREAGILDIALDCQRIPSVDFAFEQFNQIISLFALFGRDGFDEVGTQSKPFAPLNCVL